MARSDEQKAKPAAGQPEAGKGSEAAEVQEQADKETEQGFRGVEVDPTDNTAYTVAGVTSGAPTPETDPAHAEKVRAHVLGIERSADDPAGR